ncbi:MAG: cupin domain-containing protein [Pseudomonadota bacterium]
MRETIQKRPIDMEECRRMGIDRWPTWGTGVSRFPWTYDTCETCYLIEGRVTVTPQDGVPVEIRAGDLVTFPAGMSCTWAVHEPVLKHYRFG